ncbi:hypothetical protein A2567_00755 [Candidatus Azambacteria bacterium RIFOXYD1_FULL_42_11]|uniref:HtrA protease/chaperone protein n=4 Tax=Candidatus Azamiibacteriota TaxID=1752741 RepID=A0A0G1CAF9_9BACT|nr:MAG: HtrA protease/chaperone protein [Candidatus Azambacteria bacterium GW2011_GWB1_42_17]KKS46598.1 MAG: HtrA protease/chaperone protein [Candidatus Azambacteria bacterium GW2011_GWA1_42_19]KKS75793.1 MAG: HtrA protease/chaperone protein [Candidatus Azambacteria bacterium GW2011_GWA2_42_9]KKS88904.1 MAG: HtrA protease/chaperone protein [Parcubacteria group bacterium GW2011_GWC1_43_11]OGD41754.1 MAG: hypothetical protein A2567_00755 [Candidatus Azambacteria bacterium RIFOXYD1_FULL_42_11]
MKKSVILAVVFLMVSTTTFAEFPNEITERVKSSIVAIYDGDILKGSGFFIDSSGTILTNYHVISDNQYLWSLSFNGKRIKLTRLWEWKNGDLALLKPSNENDKKITHFSFLEFEKEANSYIGQEVAAVGHGGGFWQVIKGTIKGWRYNLTIRSASSEYNFNAIIYSPTILTYFSGSPLIDKNGYVIGINSASDKLDKSVDFDGFFSYAIPAYDIKLFIDDFDRMSPLVFPAYHDKPEDVEKNSKNGCAWEYTPEGKWCKN